MANYPDRPCAAEVKQKLVLTLKNSFMTTVLQFYASFIYYRNDDNIIVILFSPVIFF